MTGSTRATTGAEGADPLGAVKLIVAWGVVGIPLLWGVAQVVQRSLALFR